MGLFKNKGGSGGGGGKPNHGKILGALKNAGAQIKTSAHAAGKSVGDAKNKAGDKVAAVVHKMGAAMGKVGEDARYAPILFFKPMMKKNLDQIGVAYENKMSDIAKKFVEHVIKGQTNHFDEDYLDGGTGGSMTGGSASSPDGVSSVLGMATSAAGGTGTPEGAIVALVLSFIKQLHDKKATGAKLTPTEESILGQAEQATAAVDVAANNSSKETVGNELQEFLFSWKGALSVIALVVVIRLIKN